MPRIAFDKEKEIINEKIKKRLGNFSLAIQYKGNIDAANTKDCNIINVSGFGQRA